MKLTNQFCILKLNECPWAIKQAAKLCYDTLNRLWSPEHSLSQTEAWFKQWLSDDIPLAFIALESSKVVGMCSLQFNDGDVRPDLSPWLGDLCILNEYKNKGIGKSLIEATKKKAKEAGFKKLYLFAPDANIPAYYARLGWRVITTDMYHENLVTVMEIDV